MSKVALLIGVSEYESDFTPIPGARKDVEAIKQVLEHPDIGDFTEVKQLINPDTQEMQVAIETAFSDCQRDDLVLLYFSGHGLKDENGKLYLATRRTRKNIQGELIRSTAVAASFVQENMSKSRSRRQVIILDCCFSGAFAEGLLAKDDGAVDVKGQLGGEEINREGRAVLTSSTSTQYSFEQEGEDLSIYTRYLVEGIGTGAADLDNDQMICIDELHEYARRKVQEVAPAMKPEIYAVRQGYKIWLAKALICDPQRRYRQEVESCAYLGEISSTGRRMLDYLRNTLSLEPQEATTIEDEVLKPYREYKKNLQQYEQALVEAAQHEYPLSERTLSVLQRYQKILRLRDEDVAPIKERIERQRETEQSTDNLQHSKSQTPKNEPIQHTPVFNNFLLVSFVNSLKRRIGSRSSYLLLIGIGVVVAGVLITVVGINHSPPFTPTQGAAQNIFLYNTINENSTPVSSVAISPDGQTLASGGHDKTIKLWNIGSGKLIRTLYGHSEPVLSIAISPDGQTLASGSTDKTIKLWNLNSGGSPRTLEGHGGWVTAVSITPDGQILASGSTDNTIRLWKLDTGVLIRTLTGHSSPTLSIAISSDSQTLASGSTDKTIKLWDLRTGKLLRTLEGHSSWVDAVAISPDSKTLVSGSLDKTIKLWDLRTGKLLRTLEGHSSSVLSIAISSDGQMLISGGLDGEIRIWNLQTGTLISTLKGHSAQVVSFAISKDGKTLVSGSADDTVKIWQVR